jgi:hypothetical protein
VGVPAIPNLDSKTERDLERILEISLDDLRALERRVSKRRDPFLKQRELVDLLSEMLDDDAARSLADILIYLGFIARRRGVTYPDAANFLSTAMRATDTTVRTSADVGERATLLVALAHQPSVLALIKALDLSTDYTNSFDNVRILTDLRPIFADQEDDKPALVVAAIVSHVLRLTYLQDGELRTMSMAMDHSDLVNLQNACRRAITKADTLQGSGRSRLSEVPWVQTGEAFDVT